jgi:hypothetical protein
MTVEKSNKFKGFDGIVLINKKPFITSYDVIRIFKRVFF